MEGKHIVRNARDLTILVGNSTPSPEDIRVTELIKEAAELHNIDVLDHMIFGRNRYVSLKERGLGFG